MTAEQRREPRTAAGRALLRSDFDTTGWGPNVVREHVHRAILAIEAEASREAEGLLPDELAIRMEERARIAEAHNQLRWSIEASLNDLGLGTPERIERARTRLIAALDQASEALYAPPLAAREKEERS